MLAHVLVIEDMLACHALSIVLGRKPNILLNAFSGYFMIEIVLACHDAVCTSDALPGPAN